MDDVPPAPNLVATDLAVLFADVSGSTRLYEAFGDELALATIERILTLVKGVCEEQGGRVVKTIGDEAMAVFLTADQAAKAAWDMQVKVSALAPVGTSHLAIRVGFHFGPALEVNGDVFGDSVNVASRMVALAKGEQVITSAQTADTLAPWLRARARELDSLTVKGKVKDIGIFELIWQEAQEDMTMMVAPRKKAPARIRLRHGTVDVELGEEHAQFTFGRGAQNDAVILDRMASRAHARIERRRDKFVVIDQSSNGTYVTIEGEDEIQLRREELLLRGRGHLSFGHSATDEEAPAEIVTFSCVD
jgi:adenylate cyclase